ncbi:MAG TPA: class II glutamine amidotransferase [Mesotoga sp.]|jgi:predicted glutamine amidotransferase|nr:class II glutamine amidotransferase [Thermotogota bacterium]HOY25183.1 class II glutamine amidotransferase [Mesotoga sp.]HPB62361.1 class II glutamine amidotransferase [Mesotoga sp.]HPI17096.1 class II glutamine amidotransferase [Mesotoga sp.]HPX22544.1 class II glutamine amidotransferase [Mesotoga sp.]
MCRMLAFKSPTKIESLEIVDILRNMAREGLNNPHGDGFGLAMAGGERLRYNSVRSICEADPPLIESRLGIVHARKASPGYSVNPDHVHPFYGVVKGKNYAFCHNGTVFDFASAPGTIDTQRYFELVLSHMERFSPAEALGRAAGFVADNFRYTSLNAFLTDFESIWILRLNSEKNDLDHGLYLYEREGLKIVASEPVESFSGLPAGSREIANGESLVL